MHTLLLLLALATTHSDNLFTQLRRSVHEQLSTVVREAAEAAVGSESLLLVLGVLQVRWRGGCQHVAFILGAMDTVV